MLKKLVTHLVSRSIYEIIYSKHIFLVLRSQISKIQLFDAKNGIFLQFNSFVEHYIINPFAENEKFLNKIVRVFRNFSMI